MPYCNTIEVAQVAQVALQMMGNIENIEGMLLMVALFLGVFAGHASSSSSAFDGKRIFMEERSLLQTYFQLTVS
ncbi:MAG: hypothetical protein AAFO91_04505 [Bacteroidota bacterium]